ncbi:MAG: His/Gly/Thr/Pro-type tRNA ligase C-terminal domain-containing protein, partial [Actinomycetia bacterium]|nr:His/Gly/Thr/Pro-type tRNA ligase C-terminal domain-containing protein [Actinomycetes bacterium]
REQAEAAERLTRALAGRGMEILVDDREASPGVKFNDADLVGLPLQVVIGKKLDSDGTVDLKVRYTGERRAVRVELAVEEIERALEEAP